MSERLHGRESSRGREPTRGSSGVRQGGGLGPARALLAAFRIAPVAVLLLLPQPVRAIDGAVDVTDSRQSGRLGTTVFDTFSRRDVLFVGQQIDPSSRWSVDLRYRRLRELAGSEASGQRLETERITHQPSFATRWTRSLLRLGFDASWQDRDGRSDSGTVPDESRYQLGASADLRPSRTTQVRALWSHTSTEQRSEAVEARERREHLGSINADQRLPGTWSLGYRYSVRASDLVTGDVRQIFQSHLAEVSGSPGTRGGRLTSFLRARTQVFRQEVETGSDGEVRVLLVPLSTGLTLDDTPEVLDPLEDDPAPVPGLTDGDLEGATPVNLGDSAPPVREFGGDYRNLQVDFGDREEIGGGFLYVDRTLLLPELFQWRLFSTDDPEGRVWNEIPSGEATVTYRELGAVRQGWEIAFRTPIEARFFKIVDVKLGATEPDLFVTELELFRVESSERSRTLEDSRSDRFDAALEYEVGRGLRVGTQTSLRRRTFEDPSQDLDEMNQSVHSRWARGQLQLSGQVALHRLWSDLRRNTDLLEYGAAATQGIGPRVSATLAWNRSDDRSYELVRQTETLSLTARWTPTSRLRVTQRLTRGTRDEHELGGRSVSFVASTTVHGSPTRALSFDLTRNDRWVDREAGAGFDRFNDTTLSATWLPVPLVSLHSYVAYQLRETGEWIVRNTLSWSPFSGARLEPRFGAYAFSDTRIDNRRYSGEASLRWRALRSVTVDASVESARVELSDQTTTPVSTQVHVRWTF